MGLEKKVGMMHQKKLRIAVVGSAAVLLLALGGIVAFVVMQPQIKITVLTALGQIRKKSLSLVRVAVISHPTHVKPDIPKLIRKIQVALRDTCGNEFTCDKNDTLHLLMTPEYSFYNYFDARPYAVEISCTDRCRAVARGGSDSENVVAAIEFLQKIARRYRVRILAGTVYEYAPTGDPRFPNGIAYFNSIVKIGPHGDIKGVRRKIYDSNNDTCEEFNGDQKEECEKALLRLALQSVQMEYLPLATGVTATYFPIVCSERDRKPLIREAIRRGIKDVDILIGPEHEGDWDPDGITSSIQNGTWDPAKYGWDWAVRDEFMKNFVSTGIIKADTGYLVASDGAFGYVGAFTLKEPPAPLPRAVRAPDYWYASLPIRRN